LELKGPPGEEQVTTPLIQLCGQEERSNVQGQREVVVLQEMLMRTITRNLKQTVNSVFQ